MFFSTLIPKKYVLEREKWLKVVIYHILRSKMGYSPGLCNTNFFQNFSKNHDNRVMVFEISDIYIYIYYIFKLKILWWLWEK